MTLDKRTTLHDIVTYNGPTVRPVHIIQYTVHNIQYTLQYKKSTIQRRLHITQYTVHDIKGTKEHLTRHQVLIT